jgi:type VI secretion system protein ImpM
MTPPAERAQGAPERFSVGWTGKLPQHGDFVSRRVRPEFREPWDRWLAAVLVKSRERLRERWQDAFLQAPAWRFVLVPGALSAEAWAGLLVPSVDSIGRYYPLTVVCELPAASLDAAASLRCAAQWFAELEAIALRALEPGADLEAFDAALAGKRFPGEALVPERAAPAGPGSAWFAADSEIFASRLLLSEGLPDAERYCEMLTGAPQGGAGGASGAAAPPAPAERERKSKSA